MALEDIQRVDGISKEFEEIERAIRINHAYADPTKLTEEQQRLIGRYGKRLKVAREKRAEMFAEAASLLKRVRPNNAKESANNGSS